MNWRTISAFVLGVAVAVTGILIQSRKTNRRPVMSVRASLDNDIIHNCSSIALGSDQDQADYMLGMRWVGDTWHAVLVRHDSVILHQYEGKDSNAIIRDACKQVQKDPDWPMVGRLEKTTSIAKPADIPGPGDRYELRDVRNGSVVITGIIDRQTGRIWIWKEGLRGNTFFLQEDMIPDPSTK
ncbi:MAG TPA: hypothetical protein VFC29_13510 [Candidatus Limnocylindrales bacterium]|nr:hypothetical protein [Candidatus Limnocylindrales bacterium]